MGEYSLKTRNLVSTWFSLIFFLLLLTYLFSIEIFKDNREEKSIANLIENPILNDYIDHTIAIRFKNRIGEYALKKENESWMLKEPRVMPAQEKTILAIFNTLRSIKVLTIHEYEPINIESFSLDKPVIELDLLTKLDEEIKIKVGLINPINNTSYIIVSGQDRIFQTNLFEGELEALELSHFIDGQVFSMRPDQLKSFALYHGSSLTANNYLEFDGQNWKSKKYNSINNENTYKKINEILLIKTHMIIDEIDEELGNFIKNYTDNPLYKIEITTQEGKKIKYTISHIIKAISKLKIENRQYFIMLASDRPYPYIINKKHLEELQIQYKDLK